MKISAAIFFVHISVFAFFLETCLAQNACNPSGARVRLTVPEGAEVLGLRPNTLPDGTVNVPYNKVVQFKVASRMVYGGFTFEFQSVLFQGIDGLNPDDNYDWATVSVTSANPADAASTAVPKVLTPIEYGEVDTILFCVRITGTPTSASDSVVFRFRLTTQDPGLTDLINAEITPQNRSMGFRIHGIKPGYVAGPAGVCLGSTAVITRSAPATGGMPPYTCTWQQRIGTQWQAVPDAANADTLILMPEQPGSYYYRSQVTDDTGGVAVTRQYTLRATAIPAAPVVPAPAPVCAGTGALIIPEQLPGTIVYYFYTNSAATELAGSGSSLSTPPLWAPATYYVLADDEGCRSGLTAVDIGILTNDSCLTAAAPPHGMDIRLYPNPATNEVWLEGPVLPGSTATLANTLGTSLEIWPISETQVRLATGHLPAGVYLLTIVASAGVRQQCRLVLAR